MVKFVEHLPAETIVLVRAVVQDPHSHGQSDIHYTSIHNVEVRVKTVSNFEVIMMSHGRERKMY